MSDRHYLWLLGWLVIMGAGSGCERAGRSQPASPPAEKPAPPQVIDDAQKAYLWDIETHGNKLARTPYGLKALGNAVSCADRQTLDSLLAADFQGETLGEPCEEIRTRKEFCEVLRQQEGKTPRQKLDRGQFIHRLLQFREIFHQPPKFGLALMKLAPMQQSDPQGNWRGTCQWRMYGETAPGKPAEVILYLEYLVPEPTEENLTKPGWLRQAAITQIQVAKAPHYLLRDVTAERGIDTKWLHDNWRSEDKGKLSPNTGGVYLCDFNRDGILDMLVTDLNKIALYQGLPGGKFRNVTTEVGLPTSLPTSTDPTAIVDLDGDGWEDIILGEKIYQNLKGKGFQECLSNMRLPRDGTGVAILDFDGDGFLDLYVTRPGDRKKGDWLLGKAGDPNKGNQLWRNNGKNMKFYFENVTAKSHAAAGNRSCFSAVCLDANNDGWPDLYVINEFGNGVLLVNNQDGTFKEHLMTHGAGDFGSMGVTCGSIENNGNIDIYCANMYSKAGSRVIGNVLPGSYPDDIMDRMRHFVQGSQLWKNLGGLQFEPRAQRYQIASIGWAYGAALVDLDNDGWLDLFATAGFVSQSRTEPDG
jgi:FG-GAP-like repeat/FG-GAP repeat